MKTFFSTLLSRLIAQKLAVILLSAGSILTSVTLWYQTYLAKYLADPTGKVALLFLLLFVLSGLSAIGSYYWFKPKYIFISDLGINQNLKTGAYFCSPCLVKEKLHAPLTITDTGWRCRVCGKMFSDPSKRIKTQPWVPLDPVVGY